jgi:hypothetical protein
MVHLRSSGGQSRSNRAQVTGQPACEAQEIEAPQNIRRKNRSNEGRSAEIVGCRVHQGSKIPAVASKSSNGPQKEWKVMNVHRFY